MNNVRQMSKVKAVYNSFSPEIVDGNSKTKFSFFPAYIYTCFTFTLHSTALLKYIIEIDSNFVCKIIENNLSKKIETEKCFIHLFVIPVFVEKSMRKQKKIK